MCTRVYRYGAAVLLRGRWLVVHLLVLFTAGVFAALGVWQLARNNQKHDKIAAERRAYAAPAPELTGASDPASGTRAQASGTYDVADQVVLRDQVRGAATGIDILTRLKLDDGTQVLVDRGWMAGDLAFVPPPPNVRVVVRGIVQSGHALSSSTSARTVDGALSLPQVDLPRIGTCGLTQRPRTIWLLAQFQSPPPPLNLPKLPQPPPPDPVNHLEYTIEWFALAAIPLFGWPVVLWRRVHRT